MNKKLDKRLAFTDHQALSIAESAGGHSAFGPETLFEERTTGAVKRIKNKYGMDFPQALAIRKNCFCSFTDVGQDFLPCLLLY